MPKRRKSRADPTPGQAIVNALWEGMRKLGIVSGRTPAEAVIADWIARDCPLDARAEASDRLAKSIVDVADRYWKNIERLRQLPSDDPEHHFTDVDGNPFTPEYDSGAAPDDTLLKIIERPAAYIQPEWSGLQATAGQRRALWMVSSIGIRTLAAVHEIWQALPAEKRPKHPLQPVLLAWHKRAGAQYRVKRQGSLVEWHRADPADMRLLDIGEAPSMRDLAEDAQNGPAAIWKPADPR